jgi:hypothetical protein
MNRFSFPFSTLVHTLPLVVLMALFSACKEEVDDQSPRVFIDSPFENQTFQSTDTIEAAATITDNEQVVYVDLELLDLDFNQVSVKQRYAVSGSTVEFGQLFPVGNPNLETGDYYLAFRASDGDNVGSAFVKIRINAIPRVLEGVFVVTVQNNQTRIYRSEEGTSPFEFEHDLFSDAVGAALNFQDNVLAVAGGDVGDAVFLETGEYQMVNSLPGFGTPDLPFFVSLQFDSEKDRFYLSQRDETIRIFNGDGESLAAFSGLPNHLANAFYGSGEHLYASEKELDGPIRSLTRYTQMGLLLNVFPVSGDVRGVFPKSGFEEFVWVDDPEGLELRILNEQTELLAQPYERPGARLFGVVRISGNSFIINTTDGLLRYNFSNGGTVILDSSSPEGELYFDDLSGLVYLVSGNELIVYTTSGEAIGGATFIHPVIYVGFDYNR